MMVTMVIMLKINFEILMYISHAIIYAYSPILALS